MSESGKSEDDAIDTTVVAERAELNDVEGAREGDVTVSEDKPDPEALEESTEQEKVSEKDAVEECNDDESERSTEQEKVSEKAAVEECNDDESERSTEQEQVSEKAAVEECNDDDSDRAEEEAIFKEPAHLRSEGGCAPGVTAFGGGDKPTVEEWDAYTEWLLSVVNYPPTSVDVLKKTKPWARKMTSRLCVFLHFYRLDIPINFMAFILAAVKSITAMSIDTRGGWRERGRVVWETADFITVPVVRGNPAWFCEKKAIVLTNLTDYPTAKGMDENTAKEQERQMLRINWELERQTKKQEQKLKEEKEKMIRERALKEEAEAAVAKAATAQDTEQADGNNDDDNKNNDEGNTSNQQMASQEMNQPGWFSSWFSWKRAPPRSPPLSPREDSSSSQSPSATPTPSTTEETTEDAKAVEEAKTSATVEEKEEAVPPATIPSNITIDEDFDVSKWLKTIKMDQYAEAFLENGYDDKAVIRMLDDNDLEAIGVKLAGHRKKLKIFCSNV